jgi:hypothetical protein
MNELPMSVRPALRRLARRLAIGLFLDVWPAWAVASLLIAGLAALVCRMFVASAASSLRWLWLAPFLAAVPAVIACFMRAYRPAEVVALADWLAGGHGLLLTLLENNDPAWTSSPMLERTSRFALPRLRPWRKLAALPPAIGFLVVALWLPQRTPAQGTAILADDIAADLTGTLMELKQQALVTPDEEKKLEEEIDRIRRGAQERVDASSWEAADALRERVAAGLSEKRDAVKWAEASLARYAAAAQAGVPGARSVRAGVEAGGKMEAGAEAQAAELAEALEKLAKSGLLAGAPADLQQLLKGGKLPTDAGSLAELTASLSKYLAETKGRFGGVARLGKEFGRFDPSEFPLDASQSAPDGDGDPGSGGINRGRADAPLTWGKESLPFDRFKAQALPPGAARSPDDWAPLVEFRGAPLESPVPSTSAAARQYAAAAGQTAWRRTLAPRHQSAVKKYFEK